MKIFSGNEMNRNTSALSGVAVRRWMLRPRKQIFRDEEISREES